MPTNDGVHGQWAALYVTMNPKGRIALSRITHEKMGAPKAYVVLFDAANNIIGLKPAALAARNARKACLKGGSGAGRYVNAYRLVQEANIRLRHSIQFDPEIDHDGILQLDLRTAKVSARSSGHYTRKQKQAADEADRTREF